MSKVLGSKRTIIALLIIVVVLVAGVVWLRYSTYFLGGPSATSEKIGVVECSGGNEQLTSTIIAVRNFGSGMVEITTIQIGADLYSYSASPSPGKFAATSNQIAPGQTVPFNVTIASGSWSPSVTYGVTVITKNGTQATGKCE
jgi:hypothetical protein